MRVAVIAPEVFPIPSAAGGAVETFIESVASELIGHDVHIFSVAGASLPLDERRDHRTYHRFQQNLIDRALLISWKLPTKRRESAWYYRPYSHWAATHLKQLQPDVIWVHSRMAFVPWLRRACPNALMILSVHNDSNLDGETLWSEPTVRMTDMITACSHSLLRRMTARRPATASHARVLHNGVDLEWFQPQWVQQAQRDAARAAAGASDRPVMLFVGRLVEEKGVHVLLEAFGRVLASHPDALLLIAGGEVFGDERSASYASRVRQQAKSYDRSVRFLGHLSRERLRECYLMGDVLAVPSMWTEPFGMAVIEGMASGLPVVAFNDGGPAEILEHGRTGWLVPKTEGADGLAAALRRCLDDATERDAVGRQARRAAETRFGWSVVANEWVSLCHEAARAKVSGNGRAAKHPHVLIAESGSGFGGSAKYLHALVSMLDRRRYGVFVAAAEEGPFIAQLRTQEVPLTLQPTWRFPWGVVNTSGNGHDGRLPPIGRLRASARYLRYMVVASGQLCVTVPGIAWWLKRRRIQLVHLNNEILSHLPLLLAARLAGCRVVCHLHGWRRLTATERWAAQCVDVFVCVTEAGARFHSEQLAGRQVLPIPNGLRLEGPIEDFEEKRQRRRAHLGLGRADVAVAIIGRLVPWKGHDVFLRALAQAIVNHPEVVGLVVGYNPKTSGDHLRALKTLAAELRIDGHVRFYPWQEDVWSVYAAADLIVHASTQPEPFGYVILEAMAARRPVIAIGSGGVTELIIHGKTGLLVKPGDVEGLASAMKRLCTDRELARRLSAQSRERVERIFSMERNAAQVSAVYDQLLAGREFESRRRRNRVP